MIRVTSLSVVLLLAAACGTQTPVKCTSANCSGCCTDTGECLGNMKQSKQACGSMGADCRVCLPDQLCSAGKCVHDPNSMVVLDDGGSGDVDAGRPDSGAVSCGGRGEACCANQACNLTYVCNGRVCDLPVADAGACGAVGQACCANQTCTSSGAVCTNGLCANPPPDAGSLKALGEACALDRDCVDGACLVFGFLGGYCTKACTTMTDCPALSQCGINPSGVGPNNVCLRQCSMPNQSPGGCRTDYICEPHAGTSGVPVCYPKCINVSSCGVAPTCDSRGFCCGAPGFACCEGSTCTTGTCQSGNCVTGGSGGGSGSTGGGSGSTGGGSGSTGGGSGTTGGGSGSTGGGSGSTGGGSGSTGGGSGSSGGAIGAACQNYALDCAQGNDVCVTNWPAGYCSKNCSFLSCPAGSSCSTALGSRCLQTCQWDGGAGGCRAGYVCDKGLVSPGSQGTCYPACPGLACGGGTTCQNGFCCGRTGYRCCTGTPCPVTGTACGSDGYCQ